MEQAIFADTDIDEGPKVSQAGDNTLDGHAFDEARDVGTRRATIVTSRRGGGRLRFCAARTEASRAGRARGRRRRPLIFRAWLGAPCGLPAVLRGRGGAQSRRQESGLLHRKSGAWILFASFVGRGPRLDGDT